MPFPKTDVWYIDRRGTMVEEGHRPPAIALELERAAKAASRDDWPSERTVRRICDEHRARPEEERRDFRLFTWPKSMETGALPWEASRDALDLLRYYQENELKPERPTVRLAKWYWRVCLATPDIEKAMHPVSADQFPFTAYVERDRNFATFVESRLLEAGLLAAAEQLKLLGRAELDASAVERSLAFQHGLRDAKNAGSKVIDKAIQLVSDLDPQIQKLATEWFPHLYARGP